MIGVCAIIVGRQHGREQVAGAVAGIAQEQHLRRCSGPVAKNRDSAAVGQLEAEDVHRVRRGMLAEPALGAAVEAAATETAGMVDPSDALAEVAKRGRLDDIAFP